MTKSKNIPVPLRKKGLEQKIEKLCAANDVTFLAMFGSYVRGEPRRGSDLDLAIEYQPGKPKSLFDLVDLEQQFSRVFHKKVDLGIFHNLDPHIIGQVKKEMKVIYEKR